jgi:hypothetical protein
MLNDVLVIVVMLGVIVILSFIVPNDVMLSAILIVIFLWLF